MLKSGSLIFNNAVVCTDPLRKLIYGLAVGRVVTSESLGGVMVSTLTRNARDVGSIPTLGTIFLIFITPTTPVDWTMILYKLGVVWFLNLPRVYIYVRSLPVFV